MKKLLLLLLTISSYSQEITLTQNDKDYLNQVIDSIYDIDQSTRQTFKKINSKYNLDRIAHITVNKQQEILGDKFEDYKKEIDRNWNVLKRNDSLNTKMLIQLTKKYGFPNNNRLGVYKSKAFLIFVHTPQKYYPEIRSLIAKENQEGRISDYKKEYIFWHLDGRNGVPPKNKN